MLWERIQSIWTAEDSLFGMMHRMTVLLTKAEKRKAIGVFFLSFIGSFVDVLGLAVIIPVVGLVANPDALLQYEVVSKFRDLAAGFGFVSMASFNTLVVVLMLGAFAVKSIYGLALGLINVRFSYAVSHRIALVMWKYHFNQNLERIRKQDSGRILQEINNWPGSFANTFLMSALSLINQLLVLIVILGGFLLYEAQTFVLVGSILVSGTWVIRKLTRSRLGRYSDLLKVMGPELNTNIVNAIRGFLEVLTFRAGTAVRNDYGRGLKNYYRIHGNAAFMNMLPSRFNELLIIIVISVTIVVGIQTEATGAALFESLSILALGAYRAMPALNGVVTHTMRMRKSKFILEVVEEGDAFVRDWQLEQRRRAALGVQEWNDRPMGVRIEVKDLTVGYEEAEGPVFENLTWTFDPGKIHAVVGPSGSGKSTLINALLGLQPLQAGRISLHCGTIEPLVLGENAFDADWLVCMNYLSQQPYLFRGSVRDNLTLRVKGRSVDEEQVLSMVQRLGLEDCLGEAPLDFHLNEGGTNLSGGQQQRLALVRALQVVQPILFLDEATSALDDATRDSVFGVLKELTDMGVNIIIITHDRELASNCDDVLDLEALNA